MFSKLTGFPKIPSNQNGNDIPSLSIEYFENILTTFDGMDFRSKSVVSSISNCGFELIWISLDIRITSGVKCDFIK